MNTRTHAHLMNELLDLLRKGMAATPQPPHAAASLILAYHFALFGAILTLTPCAACHNRGVTLSNVKQQASRLHISYHPYVRHPERLDRGEVKTLIWRCATQLDAASLCPSCQQQLQQDMLQRLARWAR